MRTLSTKLRHRQIGAFYPTLKFDLIALNHFPKRSLGDRKEIFFAFQKPDFQSIVL